MLEDAERTYLVGFQVTGMQTAIAFVIDYGRDEVLAAHQEGRSIPRFHKGLDCLGAAITDGTRILGFISGKQDDASCRLLVLD